MTFTRLNDTVCYACISHGFGFVPFYISFIICTFWKCSLKTGVTFQFIKNYVQKFYFFFFYLFDSFRQKSVDLYEVLSTRGNLVELIKLK